MSSDNRATPARPGGYARITSAVDELGVERQRDAYRLLASELGWPVPVDYADNNITAADPDIERPDYQRLLADIDAGRIDGVIGWDIDRITRQPDEMAQLLKVCKRRGVRHLQTVQDRESIDAVDGDGLLVAWVKVIVADEEIRKMRARQRLKKRQLADAGLPSGGGFRALGFGCSRNPDCVVVDCPHDPLQHVTREAEGLRRVADMILAGHTLQAACDALTAAGVLPVWGGQWESSVLKRTLLSARIAGLRSHHGTVVGEAAWPPILDRLTWEQVRAVLADRRRPTNPARAHLLSGIVTCGVCGAFLSAQTRKRPYHRPSYLCRSNRGGCGRVALYPGDRLEQKVLDVVEGWLTDPDLADHLTALLLGEPAEDVDAMLAEIRGVEGRLAALAREREEIGLELVEYQAARAPHIDRLGVLRSSVAAARKRAAETAPLGAVTVDDLVAAWRHPKLGMEGQREVLAALVGSCVVLPVGKQASGWQPDRVVVRPVWDVAG